MSPPRLDGVDWRVEYVVSSKATRASESADASDDAGARDGEAAPESTAVLRLKLVDGADDGDDDGARARVVECELTTDALRQMDDALAAVSARVEALKAKGATPSSD